MFDITTQAVAPTASIHIKNAAGELLFADAERTLPVKIELYGPGSVQFGVNESKQTARSLRRMNENDMKLTAPDFEERLRETADDLASVTKGFINFDYPPAGGAQGHDLFAAVYGDITLGFIVKQVQKTLADWSSFKVGSGTN